jgi:hypothetical protein
MNGLVKNILTRIFPVEISFTNVVSPFNKNKGFFVFIDYQYNISLMV